MKISSKRIVCLSLLLSHIGDELFSPHASHQPHVEVEGVDYIFTPPCSFHTRKLIQQEIESQYPKLFVCERPEDNAVHPDPRDRIG